MNEDLYVFHVSIEATVYCYMFSLIQHFFMMITLPLHFSCNSLSVERTCWLHLLHVYIMIISASCNITFVLCIFPFNYRKEYVTILNSWLLLYV